MTRGAQALAALAVLTTLHAPHRTPLLRDCRSYWLWAGVRPQPLLEGAERVYLLQSEVRDGTRAVSMRASVPRVPGSDVWAVVRTETLRWDPAVYATILSSLARWRAGGSRVVGLQVDFDAGTRRLGGYVSFLRDLRARLPSGTRLGVTGLLDAVNAPEVDLRDLADVVDEVVVQTYQGRHAVPGYSAYVDRLAGTPLRFRLGVVQGEPWVPPKSLEGNPRFEGYVEFLVNPHTSGP